MESCKKSVLTNIDKYYFYIRKGETVRLYNFTAANQEIIFIDIVEVYLLQNLIRYYSKIYVFFFGLGKNLKNI